MGILIESKIWFCTCKWGNYVSLCYLFGIKFVYVLMLIELEMDFEG
jgi:hypothetical protein